MYSNRLFLYFLAVEMNSRDTDATLTDDLENTKAMNDLKNALLSSSDTNLDSDPPPRVFLRRRAKMPIKKPNPLKLKKKLAAERQEKQIKKLNPAQRRYMRRRVDGLRVSLAEKKESRLQRLLKEIESKTVEELDTEKKLSKR